MHKDVAISLDGCLAHVASGSSFWACGGLRQCETCGFSKQDVEAESSGEVSAHTNEARPPGAHTNAEAEPKVTPVRRSSRLAGASGVQVPEAWYLPDGFCVQQRVPSAEELDDLEAAEMALVGRRLMYNWLPPVRLPSTLGTYATEGTHAAQGTQGTHTPPSGNV